MDAHHKTNRRPKAPEPDTLNAIREMDDASESDEDATASENDQCASEAGESDDNDTGRAARHSRTPYGSKPLDFTQLHAYPPNWRDVLEDAKGCGRLGASINRTFTSRNKGLKDANDALLETMATSEQDSNSVERGARPVFAFFLQFNTVY